jgi:NDP-hexose 4-ketoreductase
VTSPPRATARLLITGATGFLGGHVLRRALAARLAVVTAGRRQPAGAPEHRVIDLASASQDQVRRLIAEVRPDAVINCAGLTTGDPADLAAVNVDGVYALAGALLMSSAPSRLVHLGSAAEYGPGARGRPVTESAISRPASLYGASKLAGTRLTELARLGGLDAVVLRVFNPVGCGAPRAGLPGRLAAELCRAIRDGSAVSIGALDGVRDFVDARDVADAVLAAATAPALPLPILNVGSGAGTPVRTLVTGLLALSGYAGEVHEDAPGSGRSAQGSWQQADITAIRDTLGWQPSRSLSASLEDLWKDNCAGTSP